MVSDKSLTAEVDLTNETLADASELGLSAATGDYDRNVSISNDSIHIAADLVSRGRGEDLVIDVDSVVASCSGRKVHVVVLDARGRSRSTRGRRGSRRGCAKRDRCNGGGGGAAGAELASVGYKETAV